MACGHSIPVATLTVPPEHLSSISWVTQSPGYEAQSFNFAHLNAVPVDKYLNHKKWDKYCKDLKTCLKIIPPNYAPDFFMPPEIMHLGSLLPEEYKRCIPGDKIDGVPNYVAITDPVVDLVPKKTYWGLTTTNGPGPMIRSLPVAELVAKMRPGTVWNPPLPTKGPTSSNTKNS
jgi:hypothetical protein